MAIGRASAAALVATARVRCAWRGRHRHGCRAGRREGSHGRVDGGAVAAQRRTDPNPIVTGGFNAVRVAAMAVWNWVKANWPLLLSAGRAHGERLIVDPHQLAVAPLPARLACLPDEHHGRGAHARTSWAAGVDDEGSHEAAEQERDGGTKARWRSGKSTAVENALLSRVRPPSGSGPRPRSTRQPLSIRR